MIKRPLYTGFSSAVLEGRKTTTIRDTAWPVGKTVMLYNWTGKPYRSKQKDVAPVVVVSARPIKITHREDGGMLYAYGATGDRPLHETEGFASRLEMDAWFRPLVKRGQTIQKALMQFRLADVLGSTLYLRIMKQADNDEDRERGELMRKVWSPTPWMLDVHDGGPGLDGREHEIRNWLNRHFGRESSPIHGREGLWHQGNVTMQGRTWYGFATEEMMRQFAVIFCEPNAKLSDAIRHGAELSTSARGGVRNL